MTITIIYRKSSTLISQLGDMFIVNHVVDHHNINVLS